jgi:hypothetical protein
MNTSMMMDADPSYNWSGRWTGLVANQDLQMPVSGNTNGADQTITMDSRLFVPGSGLRHQVTMTNSTYNPYVNFSGVYGQTRSAATTEYSLMYQPGKRQTRLGDPQGWWAQGGVMMTRVDYTPGMVSEVTPIYAVHGMGGYQAGNWNMFGGIKPMVVSGQVTFTAPTGVDTDGVMQYSTVTNNLAGSDPVAYAGIKYQQRFLTSRGYQHLVGFRLQAAQDGTNHARAYYTVNF